MTSSPAPYQVFVSHSSIDQWVAQQLAQHITQCGAGTFLDCFHIDHGDVFEEKIVVGAKASQELVVLLTPKSIESRYVWMEIGMFRVDRKRIIGVMYDLTLADITSDPRVPMALKEVDLVELNHIEGYFTQLKGRISLEAST